MAKKDVDKYYFKILQQYTAAKEELKDCEEALKDGFVTEEQLQELIDDFKNIEANKDRITYIMYLFHKPQRKQKVPSYDRQNAKLLKQLTEVKATEEDILKENNAALIKIKEEKSKLEK
jgi:hypothetical protein